MPTGLRRHHNTGDLHAININCFRKRPLFATAEPCNTLLTILEETRVRHDFQIIAFVVMPTHIHLIASEPAKTPLSTAIQILKQRFSCSRTIDEHIWEPRYYDFNLWSPRKITEKIEYIHMNPVKAGLTPTPDAWPWSSHRFHACGEPCPITLTDPNHWLAQRAKF